MKILFTALASILLLATACKKSKDEPVLNPDIIYNAVNQTLKTYTPPPNPTARFEYVGGIEVTSPDVAIGILMSWEETPNGMYLHPNNSDGALITGDHGLIKGLDANVTINATSNWNYNSPAISYDYVTNTTSSKGDFAGKGDKYIGFMTIDGGKKYYGWAKLNVSADGRTVKLIEFAVQKKPETAIKTGEK